MPSKREKADDWEVEAPLDLAATLEELIASPPFKEVSDEHGHSATAGTRIPFWLDRRVKLLKEMHGSPYELVSDVLRDAIFLGMRVLAMRHRMSPDWEVETKLAQVVDATGASRRIRSQVEELIKAIDEMLRDNDMEKASEHLTDYVLAAVDLENEWHKKKVFDILNGSRVVKDVAQYCPRATQQILELGGKT